MLSFTPQTISGPLDFLRTSIAAERQLDVVTSAFSVFAFAEMRSEVEFQPEWK